MTYAASVHNNLRLSFIEIFIFSVNSVTDLISTVPGSSFIKTNRGNNRRETVFSTQSMLNKSTGIYRKFVARQHSGKHASTKMGDDVFRGVHAKELS
jgi:hypothetical protein